MLTIEQILEAISGSGVVEDMSKFDPGKTFKENGVDSLDVFTILLAIEEKLEIQFSEEESNLIHSANDILKYKNSN